MNKRQAKKQHKKKEKHIFYLFMFDLINKNVPLALFVPKYADRKAIIKAYKKVNNM